MNPKHLETQNEIKGRIAFYIESRKKTAKELSVEVFCRGEHYLSRNMVTDRVIGMIALRHMAKSIEIPRSLMGRAEREYKERLIIRGKRISAHHEGAAWVEETKTLVERFRESRPPQHQVWAGVGA